MEKEYEQMQMDTRTQVEKKAFNLTVDAITEIKHMLAESGGFRNQIRTKHEAYGLAAQHQAKISAENKLIKKKLEELLAMLEDPDCNAPLQVDSIAGEMVQMAKAALLAAAEVGRATRDLLNQAEAEDGEK